MGLDSKKFLFTIISLVILVSSLSAFNFMHSVFAQTSNTPPQNTKGSENQQEKYNPSLQVAPGSGTPGTEVSIFGSGYPPNAHILLKIDWASGAYEEDTNAAGFFSFDTAVPDVKPGTYDIRAANVKAVYDPNAEFKSYLIYIQADSSFTVIGKKIVPPTHPKSGVNGGTPPNPPPPPPPPPQPPTTTPTSSSNGGGGGSSFFTINPTSGPPGTVVSLNGGGFTGSILAVFVGGTRLENGIIQSTGGGSISGSVTIPQSAQPGPLTISVEFSDFTGIATFTVTGKKVVTNPTVPVNTEHVTPPPPQQGMTKTTGKSTLSTVPNNVKLTLPTTPSTGKLTLPTTSNKIKSCPAGSMMINQMCIAKGKVVGALQ